MKVATYNLEFLFDEGLRTRGNETYTFSKEFIESRVVHFADEFSKIDADVLFLQEVGSEAVLKQILGKMTGGYEYFIAVPDKNGIGNAVVYRGGKYICNSIPTNAGFPVFVEGDVDVLGPRMSSRRDFVGVTGEYLGKPLHMLGLHLKSNWPMPERNKDSSPKSMDTQITQTDALIRSEVFRLNQARKARQTVDKFLKKGPEAMVVVAGDFNSKKTDTCFRIVRGLTKDSQDNLVSIIDSLPEEQQYSINSSGSGKNLIDHILVSQNLKDQIQSVKILNTNLFDHGSDARYPYIVESDHAPIVVELK